MKKYLLFLLVTTLFIGCKKYDDGPTLSLRSKKARLCQRWKLVDQQVNGNSVDMTSFFASFDFEKDGDFKEYVLTNGKQYEYTGTWDFSNKKEDLYLTFTTGGYNKLEIKRLTSKELWLEWIGWDEEGVKSIISEKYEVRD